MLSIKTDLQNTNWLKYIISEFKQINLAKFDIEIIGLDDKEQYDNILYYTIENKHTINLYNSNEVQPNNNIEYIRDDLYIIENTKNNLFELNYDILWNAFVFLSRYEEYLFEKSGNLVYSYCSKHPRKDKMSFLIPIVNILFNELEKFLKIKFPNLIFEGFKEPTIDLSHDVDYINKTIQLRMKQSILNLFKTLKSITQARVFLTNLSNSTKFLFSNPSYWCFDYWTELEQKYNQKSTFYIYVKNGKKNIKSWLIDPSYDIKTNTKLQNKLKELHKNGFQIGLHGSYESANNLEKLQEEKKILEELLKIKVTKTRQHWLNYFENITPYIHNELFETDSTIGWNDMIGFRSGIASKYRPYNFKENCPFDHYIVPQVIMDSNLFDYSNDTKSFNQYLDIIQFTKGNIKNVFFSISWHQRVCSSDYKWDSFYKEILNAI